MPEQFPGPRLNKSQKALLDFLFDSQSHVIRPALSAWLAASPRYSAFVDSNKDKIRKKLRVTRHSDPIADLRYELQIPFWLLAEKRFEVEYEPHASAGDRSPDYVVTFRTNLSFYVEVTHVRGAQLESPPSTLNFRLIDVICSKLRQTLPASPNLLVIVSPLAADQPSDLAAQIAWINERAERNDPEFYARHHFTGTSEFFKFFQRLSVILLINPEVEFPPSYWINPQARFPLPNQLTSSLQRSFASP